MTSPETKRIQVHDGTSTGHCGSDHSFLNNNWKSDIRCELKFNNVK